MILCSSRNTYWVKQESNIYCGLQTFFAHINWRQVEKDSLQLPGLQSRNKLSKGPATDIHDVS